MQFPPINDTEERTVSKILQILRAEGYASACVSARAFVRSARHPERAKRRTEILGHMNLLGAAAAPDGDLETLYRESMLVYTEEVMNNLDGQFVPARDLRAIFRMGYEARELRIAKIVQDLGAAKPDTSSEGFGR